MKALKTIRNYYFYCGIEKDEYNALKKDAYVSNFDVWKILHYLMAAVFGLFYVASFFNGLIAGNRMFYLASFLYSVLAICLFLVLKKDSLAAQLIIYLSMSVLLLFSAFITSKKPEFPATAFMVLLSIAPMFMIDKPFFMTIELSAASAVFLLWMYRVKPIEIWRYDLLNAITFTVVGSLLNVIANSVRIKEFVLTREINIQKDTDELTGLKNKAALTREINEHLADETTDKGIMLLLDVDRFKAINDSYGHDVGDCVIRQLGSFLGSKASESVLVGRFGGDEFIIFIKDTVDSDTARSMAEDIISGASECIKLPDAGQKVSLSIGIAFYQGLAHNYSAIFKRADTALYRAKADPEKRFCICE